MTITPDTAVVGTQPRISRARFVALLAGSPVPAEEARAGYEAIAANGVDPLAMLAVFRVESQFGTRGICAKYGTRNPGNTRTPRMMDFPVIQTERGQFVSYPTWVDGFADAAYRLVDPGHVYAQRGLTTIEQIVATWAPAADGNKPESYITSVVRLMNEWEEEPTTMNLAPSQADIGYPVEVLWATDDIGPARPMSAVQWFVMHKTQGSRTGDLQVLRHSDPAQASVHVWIAKSGGLVVIIDIRWTSWTCGHQGVDVAAINVELEGYVHEPTTEHQYRAAAAYFRWCVAQGAPIPAEYVGKAEKPGIIGHCDVANPNRPGAWGGISGHTDPGTLFDWNKLMASIRDGSEHMPQPSRDDGTREMPTGIPIWGGSKIVYEELERAGNHLALRVLGSGPKTVEFEMAFSDNPGQLYAVRLFERGGGTIYEGGNIYPWDNHLMTTEQIIEAYAHAKEHGLLAAQ